MQASVSSWSPLESCTYPCLQLNTFKRTAWKKSQIRICKLMVLGAGCLRGHGNCCLRGHKETFASAPTFLLHEAAAPFESFLSDCSEYTIIWSRNLEAAQMFHFTSSCFLPPSCAQWHSLAGIILWWRKDLL